VQKNRIYIINLIIFIFLHFDAFIVQTQVDDDAKVRRMINFEKVCHNYLLLLYVIEGFYLMSQF